MRITGGRHVRRPIRAPAGWFTRPTSDRVREAVFNVLVHNFWGPEIGNPILYGLVLDAFCGSGALAFEALSRGAGAAVLFDTDIKALEKARDNAAMMDYVQNTTVMRMDATRPPVASAPRKLIFLDPPYNKGLVIKALTALDKAGWIDSATMIVAETAKNEKLPLPPEFTNIVSKTYGGTAVHFMAKNYTGPIPEPPKKKR